ncbi:MAG TPA: outer membrane protein transport protein [Burkholderiaceae bacterium]|nr:outer membrane protein transport protein [Burkholderiaceae bacterium]
MPRLFARTRVARASLVLSGLVAPASVLAAGFQLNETSGSGLGNAFAGGAAAAEDASTVWSNAAGMSRLRSPQVVGALHLVKPSIKFTDEGSSAALGQTLGGDGGDAGGWNAVPNLYFVMPIDPAWSVGIGVNGPWGLVTDYDAGWIGRFQGDKSSIKTYNLNPAVSWKPASNVALGLGLNLQRIDAEFTNQVNYTGALLASAALAGIALNPATVAGLESSVRVKGGDNAWGWNLGVLWDIDASSRVGAQYRSAIKFHVNGDATFSNPVAPAAPPALSGAVNARLSNTAITSNVEIPAIANVSYFRILDRRWDVMADAQWTGWSSIQSLTFLRSDGSVLQSTPENFRDTWKFAIGANYRHDANWMFRGGLAYDNSPVQTAYRTVRLPDADRTWLTGGVQYKPSQKLAFDFGAGYVWVKKPTIDTDPSTTAAVGRLKGHYSSDVVILSGQATYSF